MSRNVPPPNEDAPVTTKTPNASRFLRAEAIKPDAAKAIVAVISMSS